LPSFFKGGNLKSGQELEQERELRDGLILLGGGNMDNWGLWWIIKEFFRGLRASAIDTPGGAGTCFELVSTSLAPSWSAECIPWTIVGSIQVQPDTGVDKLCLINTTYPLRIRLDLDGSGHSKGSAKEDVPLVHCLADFEQIQDWRH